MASKKAKPAARKIKSPPSKPVKAVKAAKKVAPVKKPAPAAPVAVEKAKPVKAGKEVKASKLEKRTEEPPKKGKQSPAAVPAPSMSAPTRRTDGWMGPVPDKLMPRATKLPQESDPLTKREMEQVLTVGTRGVGGEGGLKGRLIVHANLPYLEVIGRDKRELWFLLQGPDQEVLPAYADHKVSVSGLIKRFHNYGGSVEVRKYSARKIDESGPDEVEKPAADDPGKLRLLSPGEVETICNPGMSVGVKGVATLRGKLEMSGEEFFLVVSHAGTRQQVAFALEGKATKGLRKYVGEIAVATGIVEKQTGWGGRIEADSCEPRAPEFPPVSRDALEIAEIEVAAGTGSPKDVTVKVNHGLVVKLAEKQGHVWAIDPQTAKRVSLREVHLHAGPNGAVREFFFTPRNPGQHDVDFYLGKVHNPMQVTRMFKVQLNVKPLEVVL